LVLSENASAWQPFTRTVNVFNAAGMEMPVTSFLKPANQTGAFSYLGRPGNPQGVSSMERNTPHAMNLWETEIKLPGAKKPLFQAIRHGCTKGQKGASKEILVACLAQKFGIEKLKNPQPTTSESGNNPNGSRKHPFSLQLANVQLMTPGGMIGVGTDKSLPKKQMDAFLKLAEQKQPIRLKIPVPDGNRVYVRLEPPLLFNFGVNLQQFTSATRGLFVKDLSEQNAASMQRLLGDSASIDPERFNPRNIDLEIEKTIFPQDSLVGKFLNNSEVSEEDKKIVAQLAHQIADMWRSGKYATEGSEPYAIQSRIALLTYKLGLSTTFNCKSGKDRTGVANTEINNLAAEIAINGGIVPQPYHVLDNREKFNLNIMLNNGGANHITKACTGLEGLKIVNSSGPFRFSAVQDRMGDVQGASKEAKGG
jgi:phosphatidylinositol-4,5-bisphosphate 4-phosphatase